MTILTDYVQNGLVRYDFALAGIPFLSAQSNEFPYTRRTAQNRKEQIGTTGELGEQAFDGWWYRAQSSFHMGAGLKYLDSDVELGRFRFEDSAGVDVWTPGEVKPLRTTVNQTTMSAGFMISFASEGIGSGADGIVIAERNTGTTSWTNQVTGIRYTWSMPEANVLDVTDDGENVYVLATDGIWRYSNITATSIGTGLKIYSASITRGRIRWAKDRLFVVANQRVYQVPNHSDMTVYALGAKGSTATNTIPAEWEIPGGFRIIDIADAPNAVYMLATSEEVSYVWAFTISNEDDAGLNPPVAVLESPRGERFLSMITYIGTWIIIGSDKGLRVGVIAGDSSVVMGPLSIESDAPVRALHAQGDFVWAGGANVGGKIGLYRLNLARPLDADQLLYPWAKDLATGVNWTGSVNDFVQSITQYGKSGRIAFILRRTTTGGHGLYVEHATTRVSGGWLRTARIRMDTLQPKVFQKLRSSYIGLGSLGINVVDEGGGLLTLGTATGATATAHVSVDTPAAASEDPRVWTQYRFHLTPDGAADQPKFTGYQLRANPSQIKRRLIQLPLLCMPNETPPGGRTMRRDVFERIKAIEQYEETGQTIIFQDFRTGEQRTVLIEEVSFVATHIPENHKQRSEPGGVLLVTLRSVDQT